MTIIKPTGSRLMSHPFIPQMVIG